MKPSSTEIGDFKVNLYVVTYLENREIPVSWFAGIKKNFGQTDSNNSTKK